MKKSKETDLGHDSIGRLLFRLAVPAVTAQLVNMLYNIVDRMYIGHIEGIGAAALTGVGATMAAGSQLCSGMTPALTIPPRIRRKKASAA